MGYMEKSIHGIIKLSDMDKYGCEWNWPTFSESLSYEFYK
jgi:hypothetical protein